MTSPTLIDIAFASSGDITTVPDTVQGDGSVSFPQGYGVDYETPLASGGLNIERAKMNYLFNVITAAINQYQTFGVPDYYSAISSGAGYALGALVKISGITYRSLIAANPDTPPSANWAIDNAPLMTHQSVAATGKTYAVSDWGNLILRSNSGTAMTDTLPGTSGALPDGEVIYVKNTDATASLTIGVGSGGTINQGTITGSLTVTPGETWMIQAQGSGVYNAVLLYNPNLNTVQVGAIITWGGTSAPSGYLQVPTSATNVSRTTYAALFAAYGTTWGTGDGSTTFGIPFCPTGYTMAQGTPGSANTAGAVIAHTHVETLSAGAGSNPGYTITSGQAWSTSGVGPYSTASTGGSANLAAATNIMYCIKY